MCACVSLIYKHAQKRAKVYVCLIIQCCSVILLVILSSCVLLVSEHVWVQEECMCVCVCVCMRKYCGCVLGEGMCMCVSSSGTLVLICSWLLCVFSSVQGMYVFMHLCEWFSVFVSYFSQSDLITAVEISLFALLTVNVYFFGLTWKLLYFLYHLLLLCPHVFPLLSPSKRLSLTILNIHL